MGRGLVLLAALSLAASCDAGVALPAQPSETPAVCAGRDAHAGVYHPDRLVVRAPCATVTGVVRLVRPEPDGDVHIRLQLDPVFASLLDDRNRTEQQGDLVLEIVCIGPTREAPAALACATAPGSLRLAPPAVGARISATGPYVLDADHGWMEIHPVYEWRVVP